MRMAGASTLTTTSSIEGLGLHGAWEGGGWRGASRQGRRAPSAPWIPLCARPPPPPHTHTHQHTHTQATNRSPVGQVGEGVQLGAQRSKDGACLHAHGLVLRAGVGGWVGGCVRARWVVVAGGDGVSQASGARASASARPSAPRPLTHPPPSPTPPHLVLHLPSHRLHILLLIQLPKALLRLGVVQTHCGARGLGGRGGHARGVVKPAREGVGGGGGGRERGWVGGGWVGWAQRAPPVCQALLGLDQPNQAAA